MKLNQKIEYALLGMINLARTDFIAKKVSLIAREERLSAVFLAKVFQDLSRAGLVMSVFGPHGGFSLIKKPEKITLKMVIAAINNSYFSPCYRQKEFVCTKKNCLLRPVLLQADTVLENFYENVTLAQLITKSPALTKAGV
ncbi:Rrf2 family transcriptional regulator [Candidatus Parcubacteria bacterium]|nr:MAG: Rrf2 family transcriptional regulator [Candidatus Parcubacteria bacterium]